MLDNEKEKVQSFLFAGKEAADEAARAVLSNRTLIFISSLLVVLTLLSFWGYVRLSQNLTVRVIMPGYEDMLIGQDSANDEYFRVWGNMIVRYAANFDQDNIDERMALATKLFKKEKYFEEKHKFENFLSAIKSNRIKQEFRPYEGKNEWGVNKLTKSQVEFFQKGVATQYVGKSDPIEKECEYRVVLLIEGGQIYEDALSTNCFDYK